jgi:exonuclease III
MDLADVYRIFHPTPAQYTFFSAAHGAFYKIDHILGHKASLNKYKKTEIIPYKESMKQKADSLKK